MKDFYVGLHHPSTAWPFANAMISVNSLIDRKSGFRANDWILDSGAFSQINKHGKFVLSEDDYLEMIYKFASCGNLKIAICQDYMCEPFILERTGLTVAEHQRRTKASYFYLSDFSDIPIMPVLQGYFPQDYVDHLRQYNDGYRGLEEGAWVGVGSVCKRNGNPDAIEDVLLAIKAERPDLRLHGFGLKITALKRETIRCLLHSSDSMAWSDGARKDGKESDRNDPREALKYCAKVQSITGAETFVQGQLLYDWWKN